MVTTTKLAKVAAACAVLTLNDFTGNIPALANAVELEAGIGDGFVKIPIEKVGY